MEVGSAMATASIRPRPEPVVFDYGLLGLPLHTIGIRKVAKTSVNPSQAYHKERHPIDLALISQECWRPFNPDNGRGSIRFAERELEWIPTWIRRPGEKKWSRVVFLDYSLSGFGCLFEKGKIELALLAGERIEVKFGGGEEPGFIAASVVENLTQCNRGLRLGLRRLDHTPADSPFVEAP